MSTVSVAVCSSNIAESYTVVVEPASSAVSTYSTCNIEVALTGMVVPPEVPAWHTPVLSPEQVPPPMLKSISYVCESRSVSANGPSSSIALDVASAAHEPAAVYT